MRKYQRIAQRLLLAAVLIGLYIFGSTILLPKPGEEVTNDKCNCESPILVPTSVVPRSDSRPANVMEPFNKAKTRPDDPELVEVFRKWFLDTANNKPYNLKNAKDVSSAWGQRQLPDVEELPKGFFIECGGYDGEALSNTLYLERMLGWEGLLVEADPKSYTKLRSKNRKAWSSNTCLSIKNYPVEAKLFQNTNNPEVNGLTYRKYHELNDETVSQCFPLYTMLLALNRTEVDFFSLDVEGAELDILQTIPFDKITIKFLLVEVVNIRDPGDNSPQVQGGNPRGAKRMVDFMTSMGFELHAKVPMGAGDDLMFKYNGYLPS